MGGCRNGRRKREGTEARRQRKGSSTITCSALSGKPNGGSHQVGGME